MKDDIGYFPAITIGTVAVFYIVFAALHDISRADEIDYTLEYSFLALCVPAFVFLYRKAMRVLGDKGRIAWLTFAASMVLLFDLAAVSSVLHPKYGNDRSVGVSFLVVALPVAGLMMYHLARSFQRRRSSTAAS
jgi:hypothetical protein